MSSFMRRGSGGCSLPIALRAVALPVLAIAVLGGSGCSSGGRTLAKVGTRTIDEKQFLPMAENSQAGMQVLESLIVESMVDQEAQAKGAVPTDAQVNASLADEVAKNPQLAKVIQQNHSAAADTARTHLELQALIGKNVDLTPKAKQAWFSTHHSVFDEPQRFSIVVVVFDNDAQAKKGVTLLQARSVSPVDVASQGTRNWPQNGVTSAPLSRQQIDAAYSQYGPDMIKALDTLLGDNAKAGAIAGPVKIAGGREAVVRVEKVLPAKTATLAANEQQVEQYMAAEEYVKKNFGVNLPPNSTADTYQQAASAAQTQVIHKLMEDGFKKGSIVITNPDMATAIKQQWSPQPTPGTAGGPGAPPGAPLMNAPVSVPGGG